MELEIQCCIICWPCSTAKNETDFEGIMWKNRKRSDVLDSYAVRSTAHHKVGQKWLKKRVNVRSQRAIFNFHSLLPGSTTRERLGGHFCSLRHSNGYCSPHQAFVRCFIGMSVAYRRGQPAKEGGFLYREPRESGQAWAMIGSILLAREEPVKSVVDS